MMMMNLIQLYLYVIDTRFSKANRAWQNTSKRPQTVQNVQCLL